MSVPPAGRIESTVRAQPYSLVLVHEEASLDYNSLWGRLQECARGLRGVHLERDDHVAVYLDTRSTAVVAMFGAVAAGGVFVPLNPLLRSQQVGYVLRDCNVWVLVTSTGRLTDLKGELAACPDLRSVVLVDGQDDAETAYGLTVVSWSELLARGKAAPPRKHRIVDTDTAAILYTLGSTGMPKGVLRACAKHKITRITRVPPLWIQLGQQVWPREARIIAELGRYTVGACGMFVSRIVDRKESRGMVFLVTDGGLNHQLGATGNSRPMIRRDHPVAIGDRLGPVDNQDDAVVGCLRTPLDVLADKGTLSRANVDDLFVVFQSGTYGLTANLKAFLDHHASTEAPTRKSTKYVYWKYLNCHKLNVSE